MGMAASQVTLLTLTSRMHDIELKAQNIESRKIELATQKDELYQNYCAALDAKKIQVAFQAAGGGRQFVDASFSTLCTYNSDRPIEYALRDAKSDKIIVSADVYDVYYNEGYDCGGDKYTFAWAMLGMSQCWEGVDDQYNDGFDVGCSNYDENDYVIMTQAEQMAYEEVKNDSVISKAYQKLEEAMDEDDASARKEALSNFREKLYSNSTFKSTLLEIMCRSKTTDETIESCSEGEYECDPNGDYWGEFNYYVHLFEEINNSGGCIEMDMQYASGSEGNQWLNNMVTSGRVIIDVYDKNKGWQQTNVATSTNANNLQEVADETDLKKIEAEYQHELGIINKKDTQYDKDLSKLETERTAIKTEMDSIKQVKNDNIEKTFGVFG